MSVERSWSNTQLRWTFCSLICAAIGFIQPESGSVLPYDERLSGGWQAQRHSLLDLSSSRGREARQCLHHFQAPNVWSVTHGQRLLGPQTPWLCTRIDASEDHWSLCEGQKHLPITNQLRIYNYELYIIHPSSTRILMTVDQSCLFFGSRRVALRHLRFGHAPSSNQFQLHEALRSSLPRLKRTHEWLILTLIYTCLKLTKFVIVPYCTGSYTSSRKSLGVGSFENHSLKTILWIPFFECPTMIYDRVRPIDAHRVFVDGSVPRDSLVLCQVCGHCHIVRSPNSTLCCV